MTLTMVSVAKEPFDSPDWIFETKLDGYRAIDVIEAARWQDLRTARFGRTAAREWLDMAQPKWRIGER